MTRTRFSSMILLVTRIKHSVAIHTMDLLAKILVRKQATRMTSLPSSHVPDLRRLPLTRPMTSLLGTLLILRCGFLVLRDPMSTLAIKALSQPLTSMG